MTLHSLWDFAVLVGLRNSLSRKVNPCLFLLALQVRPFLVFPLFIYCLPVSYIFNTQLLHVFYITWSIHPNLGRPLFFLCFDSHSIISLYLVPDDSALHMCPNHFILCALMKCTIISPSSSFSISWGTMLQYLFSLTLIGLNMVLINLRYAVNRAFTSFSVNTIVSTVYIIVGRTVTSSFLTLLYFQTLFVTVEYSGCCQYLFLYLSLYFLFFKPYYVSFFCNYL